MHPLNEQRIPMVPMASLLCGVKANPVRDMVESSCGRDVDEELFWVPSVVVDHVSL